MTATRIFARASFLVALVAPLLVWSPAGHTQNGASSTSTPFDKLRFREIGPATVGGRIDDFAALESNPAVFYVATATGGVLKTVNNGTTFESVFDNEATSSIGDVAIAPNDANLVWVGTGESNFGADNYYGAGILKSIDGGANWTQLAQSTFGVPINSIPPTIGGAKIGSLAILKGSGGQIAIAAVQLRNTSSP